MTGSLQRTSKARIAAGLAAGPAALSAASLAFLVTDRSVPLEAALASAATLLGVAAPTTLALGLPAHLALARLGAGRLWHYVLSGAMLGAFAGEAFVAPFDATLAARGTAAVLGGGAGVFVATLFWVIAVHPRVLTARDRRATDA